MVSPSSPLPPKKEFKLTNKKLLMHIFAGDVAHFGAGYFLFRRCTLLQSLPKLSNFVSEAGGIYFEFNKKIPIAGT